MIQCEHAVQKISPSECPFCDDWVISLRELNNGVERRFVNLHQFEKHLGKHLQTLALFVLPQMPGEVDMNDTASDAEESIDMVALQNALPNIPGTDDIIDNDSPSWSVAGAMSREELVFGYPVTDALIRPREVDAGTSKASSRAPAEPSDMQMPHHAPSIASSSPVTLYSQCIGKRKVISDL